MEQKNIIAFHGLMSTSFRQLHVMSPACEELLPDDAYSGHTNGLCGGAVPDGLFLTIGMHTGNVLITVEVHGSPPALDQSWDEIVETSCSFSENPIYLYGWAGDSAEELPLEEGEYRARFCAKGFGTSEENGEPDESYLLVLWPEPARPDVILKQTSQNAAYWHAARKH